MSPLRIVLVLMTLAISPPVFAGESMGGDMSNTILAKGKILDRKVFHEKDSKRPNRVKFVYAVKYKERIYYCVVEYSGTYCSGTSED